MTGKIMTLHPEGKQGVNIDQAKYDVIKDAILDSLRDGTELPFKLLPEQVSQRVPDFGGSVTWYVTTVKLDLEARGIIERVAGESPQVLRKTTSG